MSQNSDCKKSNNILFTIYEQLCTSSTIDMHEKLFKSGFLKNFIEDMNFIDDLNFQEHPRYILLILRNTLESTIVFKALNKKHSTVPEIYADYLGEHVDLDCYESINTIDDNPQQVLKNLVGNRMTLYRNNFRELSQIFEIPEDETSLYNLYKVLSDYCHNSYFEDIMESIAVTQPDYDVPKSKDECKKIINTIKLTLITSVIEEFHDDSPKGSTVCLAKDI